MKISINQCVWEKNSGQLWQETKWRSKGKVVSIKGTHPEAMVDLAVSAP
ncbi:hypothetical protein [Dyadobacter sp. CY356]|nr:hypothetical protein [Dyadobacter sp. CY356]MCF0055261.1 hypothetical protein [Dyadobacter sp. CY356]